MLRNQSFRSKIFGTFLRWISKKTFPNDEIEFIHFINKRRIENDKPYVLPDGIKRKYGIIKEAINGMDYYTINKNGTGKKEILYLHGGGYVFQADKYQWNWIGRLTNNTNATTTVPVYPLIPHHQHEDAFDQLLPLYQKLLAKTSPQNIVILGDSAGGGLTLALAQLLNEKGLPQPGEIVLLYPWLDISMTNPEIKQIGKNAILSQYGLVQLGKVWAGTEDPKNYLLSPINGELKGLGDISLFIGQYDLFLPDSRKLRDIAAKQGVTINYHEYAKQIHLFNMMPTPEGRQVTTEIMKIINKGSFRKLCCYSY
jgi:acetyl esterase/lipase